MRRDGGAALPERPLHLLRQQPLGKSRRKDEPPERLSDALTRLFPLQENTSDCGRGHSFRPSLHALLLLQLLLLYPALSPLLHSILK